MKLLLVFFQGCLAAVDEEDDSDVIDCDLMGQDSTSPEVPPEVALIDFQNRLESYRVLFRYGFLAPPVTEQELENWDAEMQEELAKAAMPEMGALWYIRYTHTILTLPVHCLTHNFNQPKQSKLYSIN